MKELTAATQELTDRVRLLDQHLKVSQMQARRSRVLIGLVAALAALSLVGVLVMIGLYGAVQNTSDANKTNAVTACENANESRQANKALWDFILAASAQNNQQTPQSQELIKELTVWIGELYRPHDCAHLDKKYPLPDPPAIVGQRNG